jgi:Tfp pilus assembly protein PilV
MSLIELMFAGFVLTVGMLGSLIMITIAISTNQRNKTDTVGTGLGQMVIEQIATLPTTDLTIDHITLTDCASPAVAHNVTVAAPPSTATTSVKTAGNGATLITSPSTSANLGRIDFTQAVSGLHSAGVDYQMDYFTCGGITYDVRWNIRTFPFPVNTDNKLVVVGVRQKGSGNTALFFAPPVNLRTVVGP